MHGQQNDKYTEMHGQQNDKYTEMHGQQNDKYTEMHGQQNDKYTELHGQQKVKQSLYYLHAIWWMVQNQEASHVCSVFHPLLIFSVFGSKPPLGTHIFCVLTNSKTP